MTMDRVDAYLESHRGDFEEQLKALIRIPSISAQPDHDPDTRRAAAFIRDDLAAMGLKTELIETKKHPIVYAEWLGAPGKPTILIYGHYDVQPPEPLEPWLSPPFEPTVRDGNLYARGATDDKGQMFTHLKAVEAWLKTAGKLPVNVKIVIEGEEEVGGVSLEAYVRREHRKSWPATIAVISDSSQFAPGQPAITYGLKGLAYFELLVQGANRDLHSGTYGGAVANPLNALATILASLKGPDGKIQIAGFYDAVKPLEDWERAEFAKLPFSEAEFQADLHVPSLEGEAGYTTLERKWARPTCDINGIFGGYAGPGPKTVLPCKAGAKLSFRLVPDQDPKTVERQFREHVAKVCPPGVTYEIITHHGAPAVLVNVETPGVQAAVRAIEAGFGTRPVFIREGGSIPVVGLIKQHLGVDTLLLGWGQNDDNLHGPNEKFSLADFHRGIKASAHLLDELAKESVTFFSTRHQVFPCST